MGEEGGVVSAETLVRCEGEAKRLLDDGYGERPRWEFEGQPGGLGWGKMIGTMLVQSGIDRARVPSLLARLWKSHMELNLWCLVPAGLGPALDSVRALGVKVVLVSNSEGTHEAFFARLGIGKHFDLLVDSGKVGVEKPNPGIWQIALAAYPTPADRVLHLGDTYATDIAGAQGPRVPRRAHRSVRALRGATPGHPARARRRRGRGGDRPNCVPSWCVGLT